MGRVDQLTNTQLADTLGACVKPLDSPEPRAFVHLGLPAAVDKVLGARWEEKLRPAAVLVAIRRVWPEPRVVLTVRTRELRAHAGQISFPGGRADREDQFPLGTALREAEEETAMRPVWVQAFGLLDDYPTISRYRVTPVVGWMDESASLRGHRDEVDEVFEVPLRGLLEPKRYRKTLMARIGLPVYEYHHGPHRIWGATAGMLWNLQERFHATLDG